MDLVHWRRKPEPMDKPRLLRATNAAYERHCADTLRLDGHTLPAFPDLSQAEQDRWMANIQAAIEEWRR